MDSTTVAAPAEKVYQLDRSWYSTTRGHLAARNDTSPSYAGVTYGALYATQPYDSDCSWCYLNAGHTYNAHVDSRDRYRVASQPGPYIP